ncbi:MAG TPA: HAMP domain-containing sensor histidine kinase [Lachnospiraceae bacterium]|nr:HAMP domain-containing sensor histidine kinase [Lachnospiraceae bacterium]
MDTNRNVNVILRKQIYVNIIIFFILLFSITIAVYRYKHEDYEMFYNNARYMVADQYQAVCKNSNTQSNVLDKSQSKMVNYPYCILDLDGTVTFTSQNGIYMVGEQVNLLEALYYDSSFANTFSNVTKVTFPIIMDHKAIAFVIFFLDKSEVWGKTQQEKILYVIGPILIAEALIMILLVIRTFSLKRKVLKPIQEISQSSQAMIEGNYDIQVIETTDGRMLHSEVDQLIYAFELMRDELKEKREREAQLKHSQKELVSCISHDLRTPISTIKAYSEGLRDGLARDPEKLKNYAEVIVNKAEVLNQMITDLLDHSNAELNELKIIKRECYILDYFTSTMEELRIYTKQRGINFSYDTQIENMIVQMDERRVTQVFYNLVENAMKYMGHDEGKIHITSKYIRKDGKISFTVKDNGDGISMEDIPYVFDRFYRGEKSRNMSAPGCGLGLSICKYIVEEHQGEITCKSRTGEGTEFIFTIAVKLEP